MDRAWTVLIILACAATASATIGCKDEYGSDVDWWMILKMPHMSDSPDPNVAAGFGYAYLDSNDRSLKMTSYSLREDTDRALGSTLKQLQSNSGQTDSFAWLMYNDDTPAGHKSESRGHTKGAMGFDGDRGFWLLHSVPRFAPTTSDSYEYPTNENKYGQSFLCLSLERSAFETNVAPYLRLAGPQQYDQNLPSNWEEEMPNFKKLLDSDFETSPGLSNATYIRTCGGEQFTQLSKNKKWGQDLYEGLVAPEIGVGVLAETWMNGWNPLPTYCTPEYNYDAINIRKLQISGPSGNVAWKETQDHSKWCVSRSGASWTCVGDINRQSGQLSRGGGTMCLRDGTVHDGFSGLIVDADTC